MITTNFLGVWIFRKFTVLLKVLWVCECFTVFCESCVLNNPLKMGLNPASICRVTPTSVRWLLKLLPILWKNLTWYQWNKVEIHQKKAFHIYWIRKSQVFTWDRSSYLTPVMSPKKENCHLNSVCIGCKGRRITLSLAWRHCDITVMSNLKCSTPTSLCVVMNATFKVKHLKWKCMQEKESNMHVQCG